jgi:hypothetical protein
MAHRQQCVYHKGRTVIRLGKISHGGYPERL